jgi:hypothetical protein
MTDPESRKKHNASVRAYDIRMGRYGTGRAKKRLVETVEKQRQLIANGNIHA